MITVSPSSIEIVLWLPFAIRARADKGSPCDPVHITTYELEGQPFKSYASIKFLSAILR